MALKFRCSNCDEDIITEYLKVGETAKCRSCGTENLIPEAAVKYGSDNSNAVPEGKTGSDGEATGKLTSAEKECLQEMIEEYRKEKHLKPKHRKQKNKRLRDSMYGSGVIGGVIGLAYVPFCLGIFVLGSASETHLWAKVIVIPIAIPALPFLFFIRYMEDANGAVVILTSLVLFTALGAGIGAGIYWIRNHIREKKRQPSAEQ